VIKEGGSPVSQLQLSASAQAFSSGLGSLLEFVVKAQSQVQEQKDKATHLEKASRGLSHRRNPTIRSYPPQMNTKFSPGSLGSRSKDTVRKQRFVLGQKQKLPQPPSRLKAKSSTKLLELKRKVVSNNRSSAASESALMGIFILLSFSYPSKKIGNR